MWPFARIERADLFAGQCPGRVDIVGDLDTAGGVPDKLQTTAAP